MFTSNQDPIQHFSWAKYIINHQEHSKLKTLKGQGKDIVLWENKVKSWKERKGHLLNINMVSPYLSKNIDIISPLSQAYTRTTILMMVLVPMVLLIALTPKFFWENFNGDGVHAFESARLLLVQPLPFWPASAGEIASFPGITSMLFTFPTSWFIRLFGEFEASIVTFSMI